VLVLTLHPQPCGERIVIGDPYNPLGYVVLVSEYRAKVGFDFPRSVEINRESVANQIVTQGRRTYDT
jgi:sRNA-binding carbon storage regulator CsrA